MSKYHSKKEEVNGIVFDSKKEANRYRQLLLLERAKVIQDLELQVPYILIDKSQYGRAIKYVCDFRYKEDGHIVVEDTKGYRTDVYKLKARLLAERYGIVIKET